MPDRPVNVPRPTSLDDRCCRDRDEALALHKAKLREWEAYADDLERRLEYMTNLMRSYRAQVETW